MASASGAPRGVGGCAGRQADIAAALLERMWPCEVAVEDRGEGEYRVTLPAVAARELGLGTRSQIPEWHLTGRLGAQARISGFVRQVSPDGERRATFTLRLSPQAE